MYAIVAAFLIGDPEWPSQIQTLDLAAAPGNKNWKDLLVDQLMSRFSHLHICTLSRKLQLWLKAKQHFVY